MSDFTDMVAYMLLGATSTAVIHAIRSWCADRRRRSRMPSRETML
jgi:hypothetical protein